MVEGFKEINSGVYPKWPNSWIHSIESLETLIKLYINQINIIIYTYIEPNGVKMV